MDLKRWPFFHYFWTCISPAFKALGAVYAFLGFATMAREFFPSFANYQIWQVLRLLPGWSWQTWSLVGVLIFFAAFFEGSYRYYSALQAEASRTGRKLLDQYQRELPPSRSAPHGKLSWLLSFLTALVVVAYWLYTHGRRVESSTSAPVSQTATSTASPLPQPYHAEVRLTVLSLATDPMSMFMATYATPSGPTVCAVPYLMYLEITNLQAFQSHINSYSIDIGDNENGPWRRLRPMDLLHTQLYAVSDKVGGPHYLGTDEGTSLLWESPSRKDLSHAVLLKPDPVFDAQLNRAIPSHETIYGWTAFDRTRGVLRDSKVLSYSLSRQRQQRIRSDYPAGSLGSFN